MRTRGESTKPPPQPFCLLGLNASAVMVNPESSPLLPAEGPPVIQHVPKLFQPRISAAEKEWALQQMEGEEQGEQADYLSETGSEDKSGYSNSDTSSDSFYHNGGKRKEPPNPVDVMESLMKLVSLEEVKDNFLAIKSKIETYRRQKAIVKRERFNAVFQGNPGTGMYNFVLGE